ncbi:hypothetical protein CXR04_24690 [Streptomyces sp. CMB-StM0423]|nr:hypothetical protein CXR04_24690 [Streptomyces sp. CMB-StM0423]
MGRLGLPGRWGLLDLVELSGWLRQRVRVRGPGIRPRPAWIRGAVPVPGSVRSTGGRRMAVGERAVSR